jgi:hypothetical protein
MIAIVNLPMVNVAVDKRIEVDSATNATGVSIASQTANVSVVIYFSEKCETQAILHCI